MFKSLITLSVALFTSQTNALELAAQSKVMQKAYAESGRELLELYYSVNQDGSVNANWDKEYDDIMEMTDVNGDGHVTYEEMEGTL
jgi:hypothetical protein